MTAALSAALASLGATPGDVAASLMKLGLRGETLHAQRCPIARFVESHGCKVLGVIETTVDVLDNDHGSIEIELPDAVRQFVHGFDEGAWPELVAMPEPAPTEPTPSSETPSPSS